MKTLATILIIIGSVMTIFTGFTLITKKEVLDVGPIEINKEEKTPVYWSPVTGVVLLGTGLVILLLGRQRKEV